MLIDQSLSSKSSIGDFQQIVFADVVCFIKSFASKEVNTGITSMVFGAKGNDWSITAFAPFADVMNFSRASFSVSEVNTKDAPEICKSSKMFFLGFSCHIRNRKPFYKTAFQSYCLISKKYRLDNYFCNPQTLW